MAPRDALLIINYLNTVGGGPIPGGVPPTNFVDVNGDRSVAPLDALLVINALNDSPAGEDAASLISEAQWMAGDRSEGRHPSVEAVSRALSLLAWTSDFDNHSSRRRLTRVAKDV